MTGAVVSSCSSPIENRTRPGATTWTVSSQMLEPPSGGVPTDATRPPATSRSSSPRCSCCAAAPVSHSVVTCRPPSSPGTRDPRPPAGAGRGRRARAAWWAMTRCACVSGPQLRQSRRVTPARRLSISRGWPSSTAGLPASSPSSPHPRCVTAGWFAPGPCAHTRQRRKRPSSSPLPRGCRTTWLLPLRWPGARGPWPSRHTDPSSRAQPSTPCAPSTCPTDA